MLETSDMSLGHWQYCLVDMESLDNFFLALNHGFLNYA